MARPDRRDGPAIITPSRPRRATPPPPAVQQRDAATPIVAAPRGLAALLALSDERDLWLSRVLRSWRDGYRAGHRDGYDAGYVDGIEARKHAQHLFADALAVHLARWDGLQRDFGKPRPGDFPGRQHG